MRIIYFSPHLDDAIYSCGGIIAHQVSSGNHVEVWSFFTADPPLDNLTIFARILHRRWGKQQHPYQQRRDEDAAACTLLNVQWHHFDYLDCIYRRYPSDHTPLVKRTRDLFRPVREPESDLEIILFNAIMERISTDDIVVLPMETGGHIDHVLIGKLGSTLPNKKWYYPDFPYSVKFKSTTELNIKVDMQAIKYSLSEHEIQSWQQAAACYQSQISSFWKSREIMFAEIKGYAVSGIGSTLWTLAGSK